MTTYDHINEPRAELAASIDQAERQQIAAEPAAAEAKLAEEEAAFDGLISAEPPHWGGSFQCRRLGYCRALVKRVFLFSRIAVCLFAVGFWYFVASLSCGLDGAGGCSNLPPVPWKYPDASAYSLPFPGEPPLQRLTTFYQNADLKDAGKSRVTLI